MLTYTKYLSYYLFEYEYYQSYDYIIISTNATIIPKSKTYCLRYFAKHQAIYPKLIMNFI